MSKLLVAWHHFKTITMHRILVMQGCFKMGLYWQGLTHDLSKYSPTEFKTGVQYYQGDKSPNAAEREAKGYSESWLHHKGRNRHHYESKKHPASRLRLPDVFLLFFVQYLSRYQNNLFFERRTFS